MAATQVEVPALGESITQAILVKWHKADGEAVKVDDPICELETDKANVDVPSPVAGILRRMKEEGQTVRVGEAIARVDPVGTAVVGLPTAVAGAKSDPLKSPGIPMPAAASSADGAQSPSLLASSAATSTPDNLSPAVRTLVMEKGVDVRDLKGSGPGGRITREDVLGHLEKRGGNGHSNTKTEAPAATPKSQPAPTLAPATPTPEVAPVASRASMTGSFDAQGIRRVAMSKIRRRIAETLVKAQQTAAILTTFNEIDMSAVLELRAKYKERFQEVHGVGLGFMSFFARATAMALKELPHVNAEIDGTDIVYHDYVHLGIAVSTDRGLAVPVMRHLEQMSFARIEGEVKRLAAATRDGKLGLDELSGGTFTITNGGVFGSLLSTPIINPPQSAILGLHAIQKRPIAVGDKVEIRPMMYVALSYDHRIIDGKEAITFLVRLKQLVEDPARLMLEI